MNNILVENEVMEFNNENFNIDLNVSKVIIDIKNKVVINDLNTSWKDLEIIFNIKENSSLELNVFKNNALINYNLIVYMENNSEFIGNIAYVITENSKIFIQTNMNGSNINNILKTKCITQDKGSVDIQVDGNVLENTINNIMQEDVRILNLNNFENKIKPNMLVSSNEVQADHFTTMSGINSDELFYLKAKGLDNETATKLLEKGFVLEIFNDEIKKKIFLKGGVL